MATRGLLISVAASVGVVALVVVMAWPDRGAGEGAAERGRAMAAEPGAMGGVGVRGEDVDSARRDGSRASARRSQQFLVGAEAVGADDLKRRALAGESVVAPPVTPSAAAVAESDAVVAARPQVLAAVEGALAAGHSALRERCWAGEVASAASFAVEVTYDAEGTLLGLSVGDDREAPGVGGCVREELRAPPTIEAPGVTVTVTTTLTLP